MCFSVQKKNPNRACLAPTCVCAVLEMRFPEFQTHKKDATDGSSAVGDDDKTPTVAPITVPYGSRISRPCRLPRLALAR